MQKRPPFKNYNSSTRSLSMGKSTPRGWEATPPAQRGRQPNSASRSPPSHKGSSDQRKSTAASGQQARRADQGRRPRSASGSPRSATGSGHKRQKPAASGLQSARRTKSVGARAAAAASPVSLQRAARSAAMVSFSEKDAELVHTPESVDRNGGCSSSDAASATPTSQSKRRARTTASAASASEAGSPPGVRRRLSRLDEHETRISDGDSVSSHPPLRARAPRVSRAHLPSSIMQPPTCSLLSGVLLC
jgi:hypothetical protein